jgi:hypothetical protein
MIRSDCIWTMLSQQGFWLSSYSKKAFVHFTKISKIYLHMIRDYEMPLYCASKQVSNWTLSGTSDLALLELMQLITSPNIKTYCYLQSLPGIVGDKVSNQWLWVFLIRALTCSNRCACCLDADVKQDNRDHHFLCQMGQGRKSIHLAWGDYDQSWSSADRCIANHVSTEPALSLQVAYVTCNLKPFYNNAISSTIGDDQEMGYNRRSYWVSWSLGQDMERSISTSKSYQLSWKRMVAGVAFMVWDCKKRPIHLWGREY